MAFRVLGQAAGTGALVQLYKVPSGKAAVIASLVLVNRSTTDDAVVRVTIAPGDLADTPAHTIVPVRLAPGGRLPVQEGWTLGAGDAVRWNAPATVNAHLFGSEGAA